MNYKIYLDERDINDATSYYIDIIRDSIHRNGSSVTITHCVNEIKKDDIVITVKVTSVYRVRKHFKHQRIIIWLQGVQPEEMIISNVPWLKKIFYYVSLRYLEYFTFRNVDFFIYVSEEMQRHYQWKFGSIGNRYFLMPCFNLPLDEKAFTVQNRYESPSFVYAGSLDAWQCFPETIEVFRAIKKLLPEARLTILTKDVDKAKDMTRQVGLNDVAVKYVMKNDIQNELKNYKYGFILRRNITVNRVATPTKINSYMASGVIPVVSECLIDFVKNSRQSEYVIRVKNDAKADEIAQCITRFEKKVIDPKHILIDFKEIFQNYYNRSKYITALSEKFMQYENNTLD